MRASHRQKGDRQEIGQDGLGDSVVVMAEQRLDDIKLIGFIAHPDIAGHQCSGSHRAFELHVPLRKAYPETFQCDGQLAFECRDHPCKPACIAIAETCRALVTDAMREG